MDIFDPRSSEERSSGLQETRTANFSIDGGSFLSQAKSLSSDW